MRRSIEEDVVLVRWLALAGHSPETVLDLAHHLDDEERGRADRFHFERDRLAYVAAHALTRSLLATLTGATPADLRFVAGPHGKPALVPEQNPDGVAFNLTHTTGMVVVAVTRAAPVGIDVEARDRRGLTMDIAERYFAPAEVAALRRTPASELPDALVALWTLKEAYVKATGKGLAHSLDRFAFRLDPLAVSFADPEADRPEQWTFRRLAPDPGHVIGLAVRRPEERMCIDAGPASLGLDGSTGSDRLQVHSEILLPLREKMPASPANEG